MVLLYHVALKHLNKKKINIRAGFRLQFFLFVSLGY